MSEPDIVAPASRRLEVADVERSVAFYRDVLGFDVLTLNDGSVEVVSGPARVQLSRGAPERGAIVFFQVDDVNALRADLAERGARPSQLERANGIKVRMFEVRDPDGHTLWFGQSLQEPHEPRPPSQLFKVMPNMPLSDVAAGVAHYRDVLGFDVNYVQDNLGVMDRDNVRIILVERTARHTGIGSCYVYVRDADALYRELLDNGAHVLGEPVSHPWGLREFRVLDLEGNEIFFGQTFE